MSNPNRIRMAILFEGGIAVLAVALGTLLAWWPGLQLWQRWMPPVAGIPAALGRGVAATLPMVMFFVFLQRSRWAAVVRLRRQMLAAVRLLLRGASLTELAMVSALAGIGEELLFRGVLQPAISHWTTPLVGLVAASLLFGLAHYLSLLYFVLAALVGCYLGWMAEQWNDVLGPAVAHGLYDFIALAWLLKRK